MLMNEQSLVYLEQSTGRRKNRYVGTRRFIRYIRWVASHARASSFSLSLSLSLSLSAYISVLIFHPPLSRCSRRNGIF